MSMDRFASTKASVLIAIVGAVSAIVVAWITAGGVARGTTQDTIARSASAIAGLNSKLASLQKQADDLEDRLEYWALPVGTVVPSLLPTARFAEEVGDPSVFDPKDTKWILADGKSDITLSRYGSLLDVDVTPDLRGMFLRGLNLGRDDGREDPEGAGRTAGDYQADSLKSHRHQVSAGKADSGIGGSKLPYSRGASPWMTEVQPDGGKETRPRNTALYFYIKIN